jgi:hypothetical protein
MFNYFQLILCFPFNYFSFQTYLTVLRTVHVMHNIYINRISLRTDQIYISSNSIVHMHSHTHTHIYIDIYTTWYIKFLLQFADHYNAGITAGNGILHWDL